ncbi:hypothetical protein C2G38_2236386 [Gigaspora rosea]|uniref:Uncharacterized protein n=1 Tax=Gigaspora rosea TaxID=44941 RepID=A0A397TXS0_9GLOM|nr:hypothetical protein C2G38_2236386 [Gigaspora rosea]
MYINIVKIALYSLTKNRNIHNYILSRVKDLEHAILCFTNFAYLGKVFDLASGKPLMNIEIDGIDKSLLKNKSEMDIRIGWLQLNSLQN